MQTKEVTIRVTVPDEPSDPIIGTARWVAELLAERPPGISRSGLTVGWWFRIEKIYECDDLVASEELVTHRFAVTLAAHDPFNVGADEIGDYVLVNHDGTESVLTSYRDTIPGSDVSKRLSITLTKPALSLLQSVSRQCVPILRAHIKRHDKAPRLIVTRADEPA